MSYYYFLGGTLAAMVLALAFSIAWLIVHKGGRAEIRGKAKNALRLTLLGTLVGAAAWAPLVERRAEAASISEVSDYCADAREEIFRTVKDVEGLYVSGPSQTKGGEYHRGDREANSWLRRPERLYRFLEIGGLGERYGVRRYEAGGAFPEARPTEEISARYGLTWIELQTIDEGNRGIFGEVTLIYDRQTGEVLARRHFYYAVEEGSPRNLNGTLLHPCQNVRLPVDTTEPRYRRFDSYDFVSRVLIPPAMDATEILASYELVKGGGRKEKLCGSSTKIGPGASREDLVATRFGMDLRLGLRGRDDQLTCSSFYHFMGDYPDGHVLFADGSKVPYAEFEKLKDAQEDDFARLRASGRTNDAITPPPGPISPSPRTRPVPRSADDAIADYRQELLRRGDLEGVRRIDREIALRKEKKDRPAVNAPAEKSPTQIYRWVDKDGVVHFGDTPANAKN